MARCRPRFLGRSGISRRLRRRSWCVWARNCYKSAAANIFILIHLNRESAGFDKEFRITCLDILPHSGLKGISTFARLSGGWVCPGNIFISASCPRFGATAVAPCAFWHPRVNFHNPLIEGARKEQSMKSILARIGLLILVCTLLFVARGTKAQTGTSTIRGEISDAQGKMIGGAAVTLKNASVGFSRSQTTGGAGGYSFELIPPGDYTLEVEAKGFKKSVRNVSALIGSVTAADVQLEVGVVSEVVQVEGTAAIVSINTEDATIGNTFVNEQITQLPMEARNILSLLTLQPGVTYAIDSTDTTAGSVNGARSDQSNLTLDGVDINEAQTSRLNTPVLRLNSEAIEEFRVTTLNANANQGRSSAAQVNLVTKSGTNSFHGAAFEFNRSTGFTSNNFFNNRIINPATGKSLPTPALIRNTFGGGVGG